MDILLILLIVLIIFGPGKLPQLGEGLGKSMKAFKKALSGKPDNEKGDAAARKEEKKS
jgi:sec-independent protein translocase protein TatA